MSRLLFLVVTLFGAQIVNAVEMPSAETLKKMQQCMLNVNQHEMEALEQQSNQLLLEIQGMCQAGKRDEALNKAVAFNKTVESNSAAQALLKCGEDMHDMLPKIALQHGNNGKIVDHVCD